MRALIKFLLAISVTGTIVVAQSADRINYSNYRPVTKGIFANFSYPSFPVFSNSLYADRRKSIRLESGIFYPKFGDQGYIDRLGVYLASVDYADITDDGRKEAIVYLGTICDCTADFGGVYIYNLSGKRPRLLWAFATGDRTEGGLRKAFGQGGDLIVETYGIDSGPGILPKLWTGPHCCAGEYTRRKYKWNGRRFVQQGKARVIKLG